MRLALFFILTLGFLGTASAQKKTRILFIFDASNSMNGKWEGATKIDVAKKLLVQTVDSLAGYPNLELGLRIYGHQSPITPTFQDCDDTKLEVPFSSDAPGKMKVKIKNVVCQGTTPIARSLEAAAGDFPDSDSRNLIILITDGLEACDQDPCAVSKALRDKGITVKPFVIGIGIDLAYINQFDCIGTYYDARDENSLRNVMKQVIDQAVTNTTVQVDLNDINGNARETDVTMYFYKAGTRELLYTYVHTLNRFNRPDTISLNPKYRYDIKVKTLPQVGKKGVTITPGTHNVIPIDAPQGYLSCKFLGGASPSQFDVLIRKSGDCEILDNIETNTKEKLIVGKYDVTVLSKPRLEFKDVEVTQSSEKMLTIPVPGKAAFRAGSPTIGQVFKVDGSERQWVLNLDMERNNDLIELLPGEYEVVSRKKSAKSTVYTTVNKFRVVSGKTSSINL